MGGLRRGEDGWNHYIEKWKGELVRNMWKACPVKGPSAANVH